MDTTRSIQVMQLATRLCIQIGTPRGTVSDTCHPFSAAFLQGRFAFDTYFVQIGTRDYCPRFLSLRVDNKGGLAALVGEDVGPSPGDKAGIHHTEHSLGPEGEVQPSRLGVRVRARVKGLLASRRGGVHLWQVETGARIEHKRWVEP